MQTLSKFICALACLLMVASAFFAQARKTPASRIKFTDVTQAAGITFVNASSTEKKYIVESMGVVAVPGVPERQYARLAPGVAGTVFML